MRGKRGRRFQTSLACRLIPAHAGKTQPSSPPRRKRAAHPRACGENDSQRGTCRVKWGSSPRMRGKPYQLVPQARGRGLIPAHAGKTNSRFPHFYDCPAHPRACGENGWSAINNRRRLGSSPRMRGKLPFVTARGAFTRLIPAHAGKTPDTQNGTCAVGAHPRACGENFLSIALSCRLRGSSPRMRGKRRGSGKTVGRRRLIPAHAGKTPTRRRTCLRLWAHPRACGENHRWGEVSGDVPGSSPRMRGKRSSPRPGWRHRGLIPAHAGKTSFRVECVPGDWAHPRACGENLCEQ